MNVVAPGLQTELHCAALRLEQLGDQVVFAVAHVETPCQVLVEQQCRRCFAHVRQHHVTRARQIDIVCRMLGSALGVDRARQCLVKGELIRLAQGHLAVLRDIRRAEHARDEVVSEEGRLQTVRFLRRLLSRARCQEGIPSRV